MFKSSWVFQPLGRKVSHLDLRDVYYHCVGDDIGYYSIDVTEVVLLINILSHTLCCHCANIGKLSSL